MSKQTQLRQKAYRLGGIWLVRAILVARAWNPSHLRRKRTIEMEQQYRTAEADSDFLTAPVPDLLAADPALMSEEDKANLRARYYDMANMPASRIASWGKDPRLVDGTGKKRGDVFRVRSKLRSILLLRTQCMHNGDGWTNLHYRTAQDVVFIGEAVYHPFRINYQLWVVLRNFGIDWERPNAKRSTFAKLPITVRNAAKFAWLQHTVIPVPKDLTSYTPEIS